MSCAGQYFWPGGSLLSYIKNYSSDYKNFYISRNYKQFWICQWSSLFSCEYFLKRKKAKEKSSFEKIKSPQSRRARENCISSLNRKSGPEKSFLKSSVRIDDFFLKKNDLKIFHLSFICFFFFRFWSLELFTVRHFKFKTFIEEKKSSFLHRKVLRKVSSVSRLFLTGLWLEKSDMTNQTRKNRRLWIIWYEFPRK